VLVELRALALEEEALLLRVELEGVLFLAALELLQAANLLADGLKVREHPAEPSLGHVERSAALSLLLDHRAELPLRADEQHAVSAEHHLAHGLLSRLQSILRLAEVDDVDAVALREDERLHLRIPTAGLVAEVHS